MRYVEITFENTTNKDTEVIVGRLMIHTEYQHITGDNGKLIGCVPDNVNYHAWLFKAKDIIHGENSGCFMSVERVSEEQVEHLL